MQARFSFVRVVALVASGLFLASLLTSCSGKPEPAVASFRATASHPAVAEPVRLRIPAAHIDTALERLSRAADGTLQVPSNWNIAGWYAEGPKPGEPGPAVIVGHVDSTSGPAVFYHLSTLHRGDAAYVDRSDGSTLTFRVTRLSRISRSSFPTDLVYAPTLQASLRLLTCGGFFDSTTQQYRDNVIAYATPG
jgi:hypothetical protein